MDPALAAVQFIEMIRGNDYMRGLLGDAVDKISEEERDRIVRQAVSIFLYGVTRLRDQAGTGQGED